MSLPTLGGRQLKALQPLKLQALYDQLLIAGRRDGTGRMHPRTVGHVHGVLHRDGGALALHVYVHSLPEGLARAGPTWTVSSGCAMTTQRRRGRGMVEAVRTIGYSRTARQAAHQGAPTMFAQLRTYDALAVHSPRRCLRPSLPIRHLLVPHSTDNPAYSKGKATS